MSLAPTPGQTVGPFFGYALPYDGSADLVAPDHPDAVRLHGTVRDGDGAPVPDALVEIWQDGEAGWGRAATDADGRYSFTTLRPEGGFVAVCVFARGLLDRLFTRAYLAVDDVPDSVPAERRHTLVAADDDGLRFDVRLQGDDETVFLAFPGA